MPSVLEQIQNGSFRVTSDLLLAILAIFFPPFPVLVKRGLSLDLLLNVVLLCLGGFPGIIHAWYIIVKYKDDGIPVVSDMLPFSGSGAPSEGRAGYQQISENNDSFEHGSTLENGQAPILHQQYAQQKQSSPSQQTPHQQPTQQQPLQQPGPSAGASSSNSQPPPYDPSSRPNVPGDNKIQYGGQF